MWRYAIGPDFVHAPAQVEAQASMCACMLTVTRSGAASQSTRAEATSQAKAVRDLQCASAACQFSKRNFAHPSPTQPDAFGRLSVGCSPLLLARLAESWIQAGGHAGTTKIGPLPPHPHSVAQRLASKVDVPKQGTLAWPDLASSLGIQRCLTRIHIRHHHRHHPQAPLRLACRPVQVLQARPLTSMTHG